MENRGQLRLEGPKMQTCYIDTIIIMSHVARKSERCREKTGFRCDWHCDITICIVDTSCWVICGYQVRQTVTYSIIF